MRLLVIGAFGGLGAACDARVSVEQPSHAPWSLSFAAPTPGADGSVEGASDLPSCDVCGELTMARVEGMTCVSSGNPKRVVDMSCNVPVLNQSFNPDNEITIAVNPRDPDHLVAGSNDYFQCYDGATRAVRTIAPTGFFTSFDGGATWLDGQIPIREGDAAGDPSVAFNIAEDVVLMAQIERFGAAEPPLADVAVSRSLLGGLYWEEPVVVFEGRDPTPEDPTLAVFDKEWIAVDNSPRSPFYGRTYVTATRFRYSAEGNYLESPIFLSYSDDGGLTWSEPAEISGSHPTCSFQSSPGGTECDEDQDSIPVVAPDGTVHVHFLNKQNQRAWEQEFDLDTQIMVVTSTDGGVTFRDPVPVVQLEDGLSDMPWSVVGRQTIWGHQIRWNPAGNIAVDPTDPRHLTIVFDDRGSPNQNATELCFAQGVAEGIVGFPPKYDPCGAGPGLDTDVYRVDSYDGGATWTERELVVDDGEKGACQWFPWAAYKPDGTLLVAWDEDIKPAPAEFFVHVLWNEEDNRKEVFPTRERPDVSVSFWAGEVVDKPLWPAIAGPKGYSDPPVRHAEGKDATVFHGDYTGLAVDSRGRAHVVWTGMNRFVTSTQRDPYTGRFHDGYAQDAMYARR